MEAARAEGGPVIAAGGQPVPSVAQLALLGGFVLRVRGATIALSPALQRLVALVALSTAPLARRYVAGVLWGDSNESRAHASLRSALWKLRLSGLQLVENRGDSLGLSPEVEVDVRRASRLAAAVIAGARDDEAEVLLDPSMLLDLLPGWYEDWVLIERERLRQLSLHALELLCEQLSAAHRFGPAVLAGLAAVNREPLRESGYRALVRAHLAEGNAAEALRSYNRYAEIARRELGIEPSPMLRSLVDGLTPTPPAAAGPLIASGARC